MRQADWARLFGFGCAAVGFGLSLGGYPGADWDALILILGALMLLRAGVEGPSPSRVAGLLRAGRVILFMFAFAAVNRAQGGVAGAVPAALGNWVLWAVAALLLALPLIRKGRPWRGDETPWTDLATMAGMAMAFWLLFQWQTPDPDMAALRTLVAVAAVVNATPIWQTRNQPLVAGLAFGLMILCVAVTPGAMLWPVALGVMPVAFAFGWPRRG
jgi:hypothetical protein